MSIHFTEASSFATIDSQIEDDRQDLSPAQYEIIRQVIYRTGNLEYYSLLRFDENALQKGLDGLKKGLPIIVDVPEIQVSIVPRLQKTFHNPVFCCATTGVEIDSSNTKAAFGLKTIARDRPEGIFIIGQDRETLTTLIKLIDNNAVNPSLVIATAPSLIENNAAEYLNQAAVAAIYLDRPQGNATVASSIFNGLVNLAWRVNDYQS